MNSDMNMVAYSGDFPWCRTRIQSSCGGCSVVKLNSNDNTAKQPARINLQAEHFHGNQIDPNSILTSILAL